MELEDKVPEDKVPGRQSARLIEVNRSDRTPLLVKNQLANGILVERHRFPQIRETFYAITPSRRLPNPTLRELMAKRRG